MTALSRGERITIALAVLFTGLAAALHFTHAEDSPAHKTTDAIISHVMTELDVACLPKDLPSFIEVDLSALAVGQSIHVSALKLPAGVAAVSRRPARTVAVGGEDHRRRALLVSFVS